MCCYGNTSCVQHQGHWKRIGVALSEAFCQRKLSSSLHSCHMALEQGPEREPWATAEDHRLPKQNIKSHFLGCERKCYFFAFRFWKNTVRKQIFVSVFSVFSILVVFRCVKLCFKFWQEPKQRVKDQMFLQQKCIETQKPRLLFHYFGYNLWGQIRISLKWMKY